MSRSKMDTISNSLTASGDAIGRERLAEKLNNADVLDAIFGTGPVIERDSIDDIMDGAALVQAASSFKPFREVRRTEVIERRNATAAAPPKVEPAAVAEVASAATVTLETDDSYFEVTDENGETLLISYATGEAVTWE